MTKPHATMAKPNRPRLARRSARFKASPRYRHSGHDLCGARRADLAEWAVAARDGARPSIELLVANARRRGLQLDLSLLESRRIQRGAADHSAVEEIELHLVRKRAGLGFMGQRID